MIRNTRIGRPALTRLVPTHPHGTDPSLNNPLFGQPRPSRRTLTSAEITTGNGVAVQGTITQTLASGLATGTITCTAANLSTVHRIFVDGVLLQPGLDFARSGSDNTLAANLAAAIARLPGFEATISATNVCTIRCRISSRLIPVKILETGATSAFAFATVDTRYQAQGVLQPAFEVAPPVLSR
jgi:hypothetical protein